MHIVHICGVAAMYHVKSELVASGVDPLVYAHHLGSMGSFPASRLNWMLKLEALLMWMA
jgi:hypothetical protein